MKNTKIRTLSLLMLLILSLSLLFAGCDKENSQENPEDGNKEISMSPQEAETLILSAIEKTKNANSYTAKYISTDSYNDETDTYEKNYYFENGDTIKLNIDAGENSEYLLGRKSFDYISETQEPQEGEYANTQTAEDIFVREFDFYYDIDKIDTLNCSAIKENNSIVITISFADIIEYFAFTDPGDPDYENPEFKEEVEKISDFAGYVSFTVSNDRFLTKNDRSCSIKNEANLLSMEQTTTFSNINSTKVSPPEWLSKHYTLDENGNIIKENRYYLYDDSSYTLSETLEWDETGLLIKYINYEKEGNICYYIEYEYDLNGNRKEMYYTEDGRLYAIREYDSQENLIKTTYYDEYGNIYEVVE